MNLLRASIRQHKNIAFSLSFHADTGSFEAACIWNVQIHYYFHQDIPIVSTMNLGPW